MENKSNYTLTIIDNNEDEVILTKNLPILLRKENYYLHSSGKKCYSYVMTIPNTYKTIDIHIDEETYKMVAEWLETL